MRAHFRSNPRLPPPPLLRPRPRATQLLVTVLYALGYAFYLWRAFRDHAYLPYARYRLSNIHIRLMVRG
jgi:hypothetical protein